MKLTSPDNLPYPEPEDDRAPLDEWFKDLANATQKALSDDTGWITPKLTAGHTAQNGFAVRVRRGQVQWRGAVAKTDSSAQFAGGYTVLTNEIPEIARSKQYFRAAIALYNGVTANVIITGSRMDIGITGTSANAAYFGNISYPND